MRHIPIAVCMALFSASALLADKADSFFNSDTVREIRLYFDDANWYNTLYQAHASNAEDPYFPARFQYGDVVLDKIGARFKGNSSFRRAGTKKSFKLDFNEYVDGVEFLGLKKLNLHNGDLEPDFLREKLFLGLASQYIPASRVAHVRVYVNDVFQGLFIAVEQPDKTMMESRFGDDEDGNLYEAGETNATLEYLGTAPAPYQRVYELKTNEAANDYSGLIKFTDILNNTPAAELSEKLDPICDVENMLYGLALNNLFVNLDSYIGSASEYMLYQRTDTGQFVHIHWDANESFGTTGDGSPSVAEPAKLDPFWLPSATSTGPGGRPGGGGGMFGGSRPLAQKLWAVDAYKRTYLRMLARMLREGFDSATMEARVRQLADLIQGDVYADPNKLYTNADFETSLTGSVRSGQTTLLGLAQFVKDRYDYLRPVLDSYAQPADLRLNEIVSRNGGALKDEAGDADPWVEIHNLGPGTLDLGGFYLTDDSGNPTKWALPARKLADGAFLIIWLDGETSEGETHSSFRLQTGGGKLYLYSSSGGAAAAVDTVEHPELAAGRAFIRIGNLGAKWAQTNLLTPGAANPARGISASGEPVVLYINELMADNKAALGNADKPGSCDDWFEIYNPGTAAVDMSGMYLTDSLANPTKWRIPDGVSIPAGGYLLFWADEQTSLGPLHAGFKLSADGEEIGLFHTDGATRIDSVTFGKQAAEVSYGRGPNGTEDWTVFPAPTPGAANPGASAGQ